MLANIDCVFVKLAIVFAFVIIIYISLIFRFFNKILINIVFITLAIKILLKFTIA